jgi:signal transduction histidine kinase/CheY-like chemotaxis protein
MVKKVLSALLFVAITVGVVISVVSFAGLQASPSQFRIDLTASPVYVNQGFNPASVSKPFDDDPSQWDAIVQPNGFKSYAIYEVLDIAKSRSFLSPSEGKAGEFTYVIPFEVDENTLAALSAKPPVVLGLYLSGIGDNWSVYLNGTLVTSEVHLDANGNILSHRAWRGPSATLDGELFKQGENVLMFRVIGVSSYTFTGLFYTSPYYIDEHHIVGQQTADYLTAIFCTVYVFVGLYHLLLFFLRKNDLSSLYYSMFSVVIGLYFVSRSPLINLLILDSAITQRLEFASLSLLIFLLAAFIEALNFDRLLLPTKIFGAVAAVVIFFQIIFSIEFAEDLLVIWEIVSMGFVAYIMIYDVIITFSRALPSKEEFSKRTGVERSRGYIVGWSLRKTPLGNFLIAIILLGLTAIFDVIDSLLFGTGIVLARYSFFLFTIVAAFILAKRFANLYNEASDLNVSLEEQVQARTKELAEQVVIAESASRAKSEFMATMSHEIRTPLNAIIGLGDIELQKEHSPATADSLSKIRASGDTLLAIVNDILDISKIEAGNFEVVLGGYSSGALISEVVQLNIVRIGDKPITFELQVDETLPARLVGDDLRIKRALTNVLSNAIKYTKEGTVRLSISHVPSPTGTTLWIKVSDTGIGIRPEDLDRLFSEYSQLDTKANRNVEGTGLGLSITKKLLELMGGSISVESSFGEGSTFTLRIPQGVSGTRVIGPQGAQNLNSLLFVREQSAPPRELTHLTLPYGKVLEVDDVIINLDVAKGLLEPYELTVDCAHSGKEAIEIIAAEQTHYDLILMDHMMPEMDGIEATAYIRNEIGTDYARNIPIVALTANALAGNAEMFLQNGFNDFISKPIDVELLETILTKWIHNKH